jgi:predicted permease
MDGEPITLVGVAPQGLEYPRGTEIWYPLRADYATPPVSGPPPELHLLARVSPGLGADVVAADITGTLLADTRTNQFIADARVVVRAFEDEVVGPTKPLVQAAFAAAILLLLAAAANAALFLLADGRRIAHEIAVRSALGADRAQVASRLLTDALVVGILAAVGGMGLAWLTLAALAPLVPPEVPRLAELELGGRAVLFGILISVILVVASAGLATLAQSKVRAGRALLWGARSTVGERATFRRAIAATQVALAVLSAAGAGLLVRTVLALNSIDPGLSAADMTSVSLRVPYTWGSVPESYLQALEAVVADLESRPGVLAARPSLGPPLEQRLEVRLRAVGQTDEQWETNPVVAVDAVLPGHFRALGIPIRSGRDLTESDNRADADPVVVVDEVLADALWPGTNPLGMGLVGYVGDNQPTYTVVGVAAATRYRELLVAHPRAYFPLRRVSNSPPAALLVRTSSNAAVPIRELVTNALAAADPQVRVLSVSRMTDVLRAPTLSHRFAATVLVTFAGATLLLAVLGVYSVFTVLVQERTREFGVRRALGAQRAGILRSVLVGILAVATAGAAVGIFAAVWAGRLVGALLYGVDPWDPGTFLVVVAGSILLAIVAGVAPAMRASSVDPASCLRQD